MNSMELFHFQHRIEELMRLPQFQTICPLQAQLVSWINPQTFRSYYFSETLYKSLISQTCTVKQEHALRTYLTKEWKWLPSMQSYFMETINPIIYRYFVCDNSYAMTGRDGKQIHVPSAGNSK
jgi:hypothetical protein